MKLEIEMVPTKTYIEQKAIANHASEIARLGRHALILTGKYSSKQNGSLSDLEKVLTETGTMYTLYDKIEENPSVENIMEARSIGLSNGCDFVIGLGGGSPMDAAKAVSIMLFHSRKEEDYLYQKPSHQDIDENGNTVCFPVITIPTTCGTGSEATGVSVLTRNDLRTKKSIPHRVFATLALLDPTYLMYAPYKILRNTAIDAMAHMIESYINTDATVESKNLVLDGLKLWSRGKDVILGTRQVGYLKNEHPQNVSDYVRRSQNPDSSAAEEATDLKILTDMLTASNIAGQAIAITGTCLPHALSYRLTYELHIAHGPATAIFQSGFMRHADEKTQKELLRAMDFKDMDEFRSFLGKTCDIGNISDVDYSLVVENAIKDILSEPSRIAKAPYHVDRDVLEDIASN